MVVSHHHSLFRSSAGLALFALLFTVRPALLGGKGKWLRACWFSSYSVDDFNCLCLSPLSAEALEALRLEFYLKLGRSMHVEVLVSSRWESGLVAVHPDNL